MTTLYANKEERTLSGLLLPYDEEGSTNLGRLLFAKGTVTIPADPEIVTLNLNHDRELPIGRAIELAETPEGVTAVFRVARTEEGTQLLEDVAEGRIKALSAEVRAITKQGVTALSGALFGAAVVAAGAFPSAGFFALVEDVTEQEETPAEETADVHTPDENGVVEVQVSELPESITARKTDPETGEEETTNYTPEPPANTETETAVAEARVPNTMTASAVEKEDLGASKVFELITAAKSGASDDALYAALADIKISGTGAVPAAGVLQPKWLGEVWSGVEPTRRYVPLIKNGTIEALEEKGFRLSTGSELVQDWAGNKSELPTGTATTAVITGGPLKKYGFAADIAREFYDIPAGRPVVDAFIREIFRSYARVTDKWVLEQLYAAAGTAVVADTYPEGYSAAIGKLIQGVDTIDDTDVQPTFAIVAADVYTQLRFTPRDELPEFVNFSAGRQGGTADGVTIVRDKAGVLAAGEVLVGSRDAAHVNELPNSPVVLDALDIAHGGIDRAVVGYQQWMTEYEDGFILIGDAAA